MLILPVMLLLESFLKLVFRLEVIKGMGFMPVSIEDRMFVWVIIIEFVCSSILFSIGLVGGNSSNLLEVSEILKDNDNGYEIVYGVEIISGTVGFYSILSLIGGYSIIC